MKTVHPNELEFRRRFPKLEDVMTRGVEEGAAKEYWFDFLPLEFSLSDTPTQIDEFFAKHVWTFPATTKRSRFKTALESLKRECLKIYPWENFELEDQICGGEVLSEEQIALARPPMHSEEWHAMKILWWMSILEEEVEHGNPLFIAQSAYEIGRHVEAACHYVKRRTTGGMEFPQSPGIIDNYA